MYEMKTAADTLRMLETDKDKGLTRREAMERRAKYGANRLESQEQKSLGQMIAEQLNDPLILILVVAMAISLMLHELGDAVIIVTVVVLNAAVGIIQEGKAGKAVEALKKISSPQAVVLREGERAKIAAEELVQGDIVLLEAGNMVPADLRLIETNGVCVEESTLTGESVPVEKEAEHVVETSGDNSCMNMAYMSTYVTKGRGMGVVTATGMDTRIGHIAGMLHEGKEKLTPLQVKLGELGKLLSALAVGICIFLFVVAVLQKRDVGEMLLTSVSLAVAAVPEGLPAIVTIVLALSVSRMVRAKTIVRKLSSVETLGAVEVVCSDKTGTLTQNKMTVTECYLEGKLSGREQLCTLFAGAGQKLAPDSAESHFLTGSVLCNDGMLKGEEKLGDPTELALLYMARDCGVNLEALRARYPRTAERGFDSARKMMTTVHRQGPETVAYSKGAAERILEGCSRIYRQGRLCELTQTDRAAITRVQGSLMAEGRRVMGLAMDPQGGMAEKDMVFLGLVSMQDPVRQEAVQAVADFARAGVATVMITGDHPDTAFSIAKELGIASRPEQCITGRELDHLKEHSFLQRLKELRVFARVTPEHKVRIVEGYRTLGKTVAMTGDGVNDAPSLQAADIGIAMGMNGTDVARGAADFVLMDDNFATIHTAIREGRGIYENIRKSVLFLLSSNLGEIMTMLVTIVAGLPSPLKASFILWINLITDSLPALALGVDDNDSEGLMREKPRRKGDSLFARGGLLCVICYGLVIGGVSLAAFLKVPYDRIVAEGLPVSLHNVIEGLRISAVLAKAQTHAFTVLGISQLFHAIGMRDVNRSVFKMNHRNNPYMIGAFLIGIALQAAVTEIGPLIRLFGTVRLSLMEWGQLIALSATPLIVHELLVAIGYGNRYREEEGARSAEESSFTAETAALRGGETGR
ncbi:MAG: cation-translocating P-type ATPase [Lachnospiraceae bacterium]|nr:cation-translocating P-type ATPase [Lachnospiraceae bacterium]